MARQKTVFRDGSEVIHVWAQGTQDHGRNRTGNVSFTGRTLNSYGWYAIACIHGEGDDSLVLLQERRYSATTSGHIYQADHAVSHRRRMYVPDVEARDHRKNLDYLFAHVRELAGKQKRARRHDYRGEITGTLADAVTYVDTFRCRKLLHSDEKALLSASNNGQLWEALAVDVEKLEARKKAQRAADKRREKERERQAMENLAAWQNGEDINSPFPYGKAYLRLVNGGAGRKARIETSKGIQLCLKEAKHVWDMLLAGSVPATIQGHYSIRSFDGETLIVGCHTIDVAEMNRVAALLGWPIYTRQQASFVA